MILRYVYGRLLIDTVKRHMSRNVLGIETSCDDTGVAIVNTNRQILAEVKYNQWTVHKSLGGAPARRADTSWPGGVIPNLARKLHYEHLPDAVSACISKMPNGWQDIEAVALTVKPGLLPCLWEGLKFSRLLLNKYAVSFIPIHHMESHALTSRLFDPAIEYPFLTLLISGGHCLLALAQSYDTFYRLGESIDNSPGNCIDRISRQLGLFELSTGNGVEDCLSGGALMEKFASNGDFTSYPAFEHLVRSYCRRHRDCTFSFSGLLASVQRLVDRRIDEHYQLRPVNNVERKFLYEQDISNICASVLNAVSVHLEDRLRRALVYLQHEKKPVKTVVLSGGVAANLYIRQRLEKIISHEFGLRLSTPAVKYCTDNGVMIAWNGCEKLLHHSADITHPNKQNSNYWDHLKPQARCEFGSDLSLELKLLNIKL